MRRKHEGPCVVPGCTRERAYGYPSCSMHQSRMRAHGEYGPPGPLVRGGSKYSGPCAVPGCTRERAASYAECWMHYQRKRTTGEYGPVEAKQRANGEGTDWYLSGDGYIVRQVQIDGRKIKISQHREVMEQMLGRPLEPHENVHHVNGVKTDNRPENLELWSTWQPKGQRVADKLAWAREVIALYGG